MTLDSIKSKAKAHPLEAALVAGGVVYLAVGLYQLQSFYGGLPNRFTAHNLMAQGQFLLLWPKYKKTGVAPPLT